MGKCRHSNVILSEQYACWGSFEFVNGKLIRSTHSESNGNNTGLIRVKCDVCGYWREFSAKTKKYPKWVKVLLDKAFEREEDEQREENNSYIDSLPTYMTEPEIPTPGDYDSYGHETIWGDL